ncbi:cobyric acid synthase [Akkermansia glycaniphila]|uniref:cobyric acid synthase n=1 Tax=Akkermansia glycaniphila TaxID=1679444 RepID=UPI001C00F76A|nr:cobyric acid synthase [Akkermansia glycaniphila]MBT9449653.1 cobyric acid synthase [Akkermansia glycaniphila]
MNTPPDADAHGGNLLALAARAGTSPENLLDFSVNVRPEGMPDFLRGAVLQCLDRADAYPSPYAEEACAAASAYLGIPQDCILFGNGSNEHIHALPRILAPAEALIIQPAFSEYELACRRADIPVRHEYTSPDTGFLPDLDSIAAHAPLGGCIFLANPGNPAGTILPPGSILRAIDATPDTVWIIDEAFIDFAGEQHSLLTAAPTRNNLIVLRSLTKFYGMAGIRTGYAAASPRIIAALRDALPPWSIGAASIAAAVAIFTSPETAAFAAEQRELTRARREHLDAQLRTLPGIETYPSAANYILFRWTNAPADLIGTLLREHCTALRDCSNYRSLDQEPWYRAAVRSHADIDTLAAALHTCIAPPQPRIEAPSLRRPRRTPALMLQGTCSDAGKSILTAAFCRILLQDGYDVAPFKAQNMALNSGVTALGEEMGRAQIVQAAACRLDPDARMNPVLLKPHSDMGSQVVVLGHPTGHRTAREYFTSKRELWPIVRQAYDSLAAEHEAVILEGAGSPGEINLKRADIVNMNMAMHAQAAVLLAGDIDRGGVYASFLGTWMTFTPAEKRLLAGFLVNKFRGDSTLLVPAHDYLRTVTGTPVLGVVPMIRGINLPEEDRAAFTFAPDNPAPEAERLDIALLLLPHISNHTDFAPLAAEPDIRLRPVRTAADFGSPHLVIIPGTKNVVHDYRAICEAGLADLILGHAAKGGHILGICGGLQMLGQRIDDPHRLETEHATHPGLGQLDLATTFAPEKTLLNIARARTPLGVPTSGYEIHHGISTAKETCPPLFFREDGSPCGYGTDRIWATYLHGLFDDDDFRRAYIDRIRTLSGLRPAGKNLTVCNLEHSLNRLADIVRENVDLRHIYRSMGLA